MASTTLRGAPMVLVSSFVCAATAGCALVAPGPSAGGPDDPSTKAAPEPPAPKPVFNGDCASVREQYTNAKSHPSESWTPWAEAFAGCGRYDAIFEDLAHWGDMGSVGEGYAGLVKLESSGKPVKDEFKKYLGTHKGDAFLPIKEELYGYAASHLTYWLLKNDKEAPAYCALVAASLDATKASQVGAFWGLFERAGCKAEAEKLGGVMFLSKTSTHRLAVCRSVGDMNLQSFRKNASVLANTDESYEVRSRCRSAIGKLELQK